MMGGTLDYPAVCSCCVTVYGWGQAVKINRAVLDVWLSDGWSLESEAEFLPGA
jgi:hypothetical protein